MGISSVPALAGGDSSLVTKSFEVTEHVDYQANFLYDICTGVRMNRNAPDPTPIHPSITHPSRLNRVTFGKFHVHKAKHDEHKHARQE